MSLTNHKLFFPFEEGDDLFELYEERLFVDKRFFTSKAFIPAVFDKRIAKMEKREKAFREITGTQGPNAELVEFPIKDAQGIPEAYRILQQTKAYIFRAIFSAQNAPTIIELIAQLRIAHASFAEHMYISHIDDAISILISKEADPTVLAKAIQTFEQAGGVNIEDLQQLTFEGKDSLLHEAKRLSLWRKKEIENGEL